MISLLRIVISIFFLAVTFVPKTLAQIPRQLDQKLAAAQELAKRNPELAFLTATEVYEQSLPQELDSITGKSQLVRGKILFQFGLYQPAAEAFYEAEHLFEHLRRPYYLAQVNNALGEVYYKIKTPEDALSRHEKALELFKGIDHGEGEAETKGFIGSMYEKMRNYPKALAYQREALGLFEDLGLKGHLAFVRENIGSIHEDLEDRKSVV